MLKEQRCDLILSELRKKNIVAIEEITALTKSSRSTICRDIDTLEARHLLRRIRGGIAGFETETTFKTRQDMQLDEKIRIAAAARKMVSRNETLFLSCGTTIYELAKTLGDVPAPLYVATNDLKSATVLAEYGNVELTVLGGSLRQSHYSLNGYFTDYMISQMHADIAFLGVDAVDFNLGYMNFSTEEINTSKLMRQTAQKSIVLCDHSKFERIAFVSICKMQEIDLLITGKEISENHLERLHRMGLQVMTV